MMRSSTAREHKTAVFMLRLHCSTIDSFNDSTFSFVNNVITPEGGTHLAGFRNALTKTFNAYAREKRYLRIQIRP